MKPKERQLKIADIIRKEGQATVDQLVDIFKSSPETIRRDLSALVSSGKVQKIHGGAKCTNIQGEGRFQLRLRKNVSAKRVIAERAVRLISEGDTLFVNAGSTTVIFAEELMKIANLTVVTNSVDIAKILGSSTNGTKVYLLGGEYSQDNHQTVGAMVIAQLQQFYAQHVILPIGYIHSTVGVTDFNAADVSVSQAMLAQSENSILLADSSKFEQIAPFVVGGLDQFDQFICEKAPEGELSKALADNNVEVLS